MPRASEVWYLEYHAQLQQMLGAATLLQGSLTSSSVLRRTRRSGAVRAEPLSPRAIVDQTWGSRGPYYLLNSERLEVNGKIANAMVLRVPPPMHHGRPQNILHTEGGTSSILEMTTPLRVPAELV